MWSSPVLWDFLGILSHVSAAYRSLETQHFSQDMSSTKDGWQLYTPKNVRQAQPPQPGLCILQDSSKCSNHDGYYCQFCGSMDSFHFEREVLMPFHFRLLSSKDILVRWHGYVDKCPLLCAFVYYSNIWLIVLFALSQCYLRFISSRSPHNLNNKDISFLSLLFLILLFLNPWPALSSCYQALLFLSLKPWRLFLAKANFPCLDLL